MLALTFSSSLGLYDLLGVKVVHIEIWFTQLKCSWIWEFTVDKPLLMMARKPCRAERRAICEVLFLDKKGVLPFRMMAVIFFVVAIRRRTAVCALSTLTSGMIWVGNGSMNLRATMPTSAPVPAHTSAVLIPPIPRYGLGLVPWGTRLSFLKNKKKQEGGAREMAWR